MMMKPAILSACLASSASAFAFLPLPSRVAGFRYPVTWPLNSMAEKVLETPQWPPEWPYTEVDFSRQDESDDAIFYDGPRLVSALQKVDCFWSQSSIKPPFHFFFSHLYYVL
jgi:hypothetical protein